MDMRLAVLLAVASVARPVGAEEAPGFRVVVHRSNQVESLSRQQLADLFLKTVTRWPNGQTVQPVELRGEPEARVQFARQVHGKSLAALRSHWNKSIFSGREVPPLELSSDEEVLAFVRANPGAIGVVSASASTPGTRVVAVTD